MEKHLKVLQSGSLCLCDQPGHTGEGRKAPYAQGRAGVASVIAWLGCTILLF